MSSLKHLLYQDYANSSLLDWAKTKRRWAKVLKKVPKNSEILTAYHQLLKQRKIRPNPKLERSLRIRKVRTLSGVAPLAIMMKPFPCPGKCIYCPQEPGMPKSYLSDEPAAARAKKLNFDPRKQLQSRLEQLKKIGHFPEKLQIIVIGGSFSAYPEAYKKSFLKAIFEAANGRPAKTITQAQALNETAKKRIVGLSVETRPDLITDKEIKLWREYGVTKVQLGVQTLNEKINRFTQRGHNVQAVIKTTRKLRNAGFKINYHLMPNLPGSTPEMDVATAKKIFNKPDFRPDTLKIYPCMVIPKTKLYQLWQQGKHKTYTDKTLTEVLLKIKQLTPPYCRIDRLVRDISRQWTVAGTLKTNLRQLLKNELQRLNLRCQCIRCREIKNQESRTKNLKLQTLKYQAGGGEECFLQFIDNQDRLYALLRLRLPNWQKNKLLYPVLNKAALIRELQVFGQQLPLSKKPEKPGVQHKSLGKKLILRAEALAKKADYQKMAIISGVGVRGYYRKLGYELKQTYMVKSLD